jgi:hypothetical protein
MNVRSFTFALTFTFANAFAQSKEPQEPHPYKLYWSFPRDDLSAIDIDDPDLHVSEFESKWEFAAKMAKCDLKLAAKLMKKRAQGEGTPLREVRIDSLDNEGKVHASTRCVLPLTVWRVRLGTRLTERLEDELDAHVAFLVPRHYPHAPTDGGVKP